MDPQSCGCVPQIRIDRFLHIDIRRGGRFIYTFDLSLKKGEEDNEKESIISNARCSNDSYYVCWMWQPGKTDDTQVETQDVKLTVMGPSEDLDDAQGAWLKTECEAFNEEHPEWNITFDYVTCSEADAKDTVLQDPASAADVFLYANDQIADLVDAGALTKLGGDAAEYVKSSNSEAMAATVTYNGDIYGVPYTSNTWFMYYDKRVFSEDDVKSLDTMLEKGKVSFPIDNGWYMASFYAANGCTI